MSIHLKNNAIGLDFIIGRVQKKIFEKLSALWNVELDAYPRCYVLEDKEQNRTIEHYVSRKEYSGNLIVSEKNKFFFTAEEEQERINNVQFKTVVSLYFILDLKNIYPDEADRCDTKVLADVVNILDKTEGFTSEIKVVTDYSSVFQNYMYEFDNIQPYYCFRIDLNTIPYTIDQKC